MADVQDVAAAVIQRCGPMTAMKLEKLVYYCQCWHLAREGRTLFDDAIEAWNAGPVVPALYQKHRQMYSIQRWQYGDASHLTAVEHRSVEWVAERYGSFSAIELSRMTHQELPWRYALGGLPDSEPSSAKLSVEIMRAFYARQIADTEEAVTLAAANSALEGVELDADWQERLRDVSSGRVTAEEAVAAEIARLRQ